MKNITQVLSFVLLLTGLLVHLNASAQEQFDAYVQEQCIEPIPPIVPDGNIASKDEIVGASKALKAFQSELGKYRACLTSQSLSIRSDDNAAVEKKAELLKRYNASVDTETLAAEEFNSALRTYNKK